MTWSDDEEDGEGYLYKSKATSSYAAASQIRARQTFRPRETSQGPLGTSLATIHTEDTSSFQQSTSSLPSRHTTAEHLPAASAGPNLSAHDNTANAASPDYSDAGDEPSSLAPNERLTACGCLGKCWRRISYKQITIVCTTLSVLLMATLIVICCLHYYDAKANVFLSDFTVGQDMLTALGSRAGDGAIKSDSAVMPVRVTVLIYNPNRSDGKLTHASFRVSFIDYRKGGVTYEAMNLLQYPSPLTYCPEGNDEVVLPSGQMQMARLNTNLTLGEVGVKVGRLVYNTSGCFGVNIEGTIRYSASLTSYTEQVSKSFQLFESGSCPCATQ